VIGSDPGRPLFEVTLDNWQSSGQLAYSLQHIADLFPTATISRGAGPVAHLPRAEEPITGVPVTAYDGSASTVGAVLAATHTDAWMVMRDGEVIAEEYPGLPPARPHMLMSISKSIVGTLVGILTDLGVLDLGRPLQAYVPALGECGYRDATVRHLLDMRSGIRFSEAYLDPQSEVRLIEQAIGWAPRSPEVPEGMYPYLQTLQADRPHGGRYEYRSCETDVLGWVCEAATGQPFVELASDLVWCKTGAAYDANVAVDQFGTPMFDGGISATLTDLARFGQMWVGDGRSMLGTQVVPPWWLEDTLTGDADSAAAFAQSGDHAVMPGGMYRNQFWFPYAHRDVFLALGIHGQMIYLNRARGVVGVKLSSWPTPQDTWALFSTLAAFDAIAAD
jgi:CubicO group peptidase (beta-lactamase class C family)